MCTHSMNPIDTTDLLPQKAPFKMVDFLHNADEKHIKTSFTVSSANVLLNEDNFFTEGGLIENMAQSAAAGTGYYFSLQKKEIPIGYIGAVKNVNIISLPQVNDEIVTELVTKNIIGNASIVVAKTFLRKEMIASCELTIFTQE